MKAVLLALFVGIMVPIFSSTIPIMTVLGKNLVDSLSYGRNKVQSMYVEVLDKNGNMIP